MTKRGFTSFVPFLSIAFAGCAATHHGAVSDPVPASAPTAEAAEAPEAPATSATLTAADAPAVAPAPADPLPPPATPQRSARGPKEGDWRVAGGSGALFETTDFGGADQTVFGLGVSAGKMTTDNLMVEGVFDFSTTEFEVDGGGEASTTRFDLGAGVRYYFDIEGSTKPYARAMGGITFADVEFGGASDDDTGPFLGIGGGAETFFTEHFSVEYGLRLVQAFGLFDEDVTTFGLFVGLAVWL